MHSTTIVASMVQEVEACSPVYMWMTSMPSCRCATSTFGCEKCSCTAATAAPPAAFDFVTPPPRATRSATCRARSHICLPSTIGRNLGEGPISADPQDAQ